MRISSCSLLRASLLFLFHLCSGRAPRTLHPAAATHTEPPAEDQTEAVRPFWVWENHPRGVSQVWAAEEFFQKTPAQTLLHQLHPVPAFTPGLQACRWVPPPSCCPFMRCLLLPSLLSRSRMSGGFIFVPWLPLTGTCCLGGFQVWSTWLWASSPPALGLQCRLSL